MFNSLSDKLSNVARSVTGRGRLTEANIETAVRKVRIALLEADVALPVVKHFIQQVKERAVGAEVAASISPGQAFIKIVHTELVNIMGATNSALDLKTTPPAVILMAGLQGAGKTTSTAKLAKHLKDREKKSVLVVSCDTYRPAAIDQLQKLAADIEVDFYRAPDTAQPKDIASAALQEAKTRFADVLIVDTAGRLHLDSDMMDEIKVLHSILSPVETLFTVDSMTGQDAANTAQAFADALPLTGVVLTKTDGDARGGAALSIRHITGKPIKFIGVGEKTDALQPFHPDRIASRILGMGDVLSLVEEAQDKVDQQKAAKLAQKVKKGKGFNLEDLRDQLLTMQNMGGVSGLMDKLPGMGSVPEAVKQQAVQEQQTQHFVAIINSMTPGERRRPEIINGSRKRRIALGSGHQVQDVNRLLKQHKQMSKMMKKFSKGGMKQLMRGLQGKLPPGMMG